MSMTSIPKNANVNSGEPDRDGLELLRQRMETLQLDLAEVKRIERDVFRELAEACAGCESKAECEKDPAIAPGAEGTCVNATTFRALEALPWFKPKSPRVPCSAAW